MVHPSDKTDGSSQLPAEDDLGRMIRWALQDSFAEAQPPDDVWPKIMLRVQEMRKPPRRASRKRIPSFSLAPLVQAVVVSALLLAFGLGVDHNLTTPRGEQVLRSTPTVPKVVSIQELPDDIPSGYLLAHGEPQAPARQRAGGAHP